MCNLKDQKTLTKVIITGCLKVAKNSLFTGVNYLKVNTVLSENEDYTGIIGFTKEETYKFLKDYKMDNFAQKVKEHYDGYKFYDKEIFCPWDIVSFISDYYKKNLKGTLKLNRLAAHFLQRRDQARAGAGVVEAHKLAFFKGDVHIKAPFPRSFWALFCVDVLGPVGF